MGDFANFFDIDNIDYSQFPVTPDIIARVPRYALMKSIPEGPGTEFSFYPILCDEKFYNANANEYDIEVLSVDDDSNIGWLIGHTSKSTSFLLVMIMIIIMIVH